MTAADVNFLFERHQHIGRAVARRYAAKASGRRRAQVYADLENVALEGVWRAAVSFDPRRGSDFSRSARFKARAAVVDYIRRVLGRPGSAKSRAGTGVAPLFPEEVPAPDEIPYEAGTEEGFECWNLFRPADRPVIRMYFFARLGIREIGARIGRHEGNAARRIQTALAHARAEAARLQLV